MADGAARGIYVVCERARRDSGIGMKMNEARKKRFICDEYIKRREQSALDNEIDKYTGCFTVIST